MINLSDYFVSVSATMREVIEVIDGCAVQIALVVDNDQKLIGTVTDGDCRRAFLRGESLDSPVGRVMHLDFRALTAPFSEKEALASMRREMLHHMPVVDETGRVVRLLLLDELIRPKTRSNPVVIMAGGEGRRLRPLTYDCPKPMLRVGGKPLLEIIIEQCVDAGFQDFYLAVNYLKDQIKNYFRDGASWNVHIDYIEENEPLGTAGALSHLPKTLSEPILLLNGDVLSRVDYSKLLCFHEQHDAAATMCVREHTTAIPYGVVQMDDLRVLRLEEKPVLSHYVNAGIYVLAPKLLTLVPKNQFFDMPQLIELVMHQQNRVLAFPIHEYWLDVGHPETLELARVDWP